MLADLLVPDAALGYADDAPARDASSESAFLFLWPAFLGLLIAYVAATGFFYLACGLVWPLGRTWADAVLETVWHGTLLLAALRIMERYGRAYRLRFAGFGTTLDDAFRQTAAGVAAALVGYLLLLCVDKPPFAALDALVGALTRGAGRLGALAAWRVFPAASEEVVFRGLVYTLLARRWGAARAVVCSAALFSLAHQNPVRYSLWGFELSGGEVLSRFATGLLFGWLRASTRSLVASTSAHAAFNVLVEVCN